MPLGGTKEALIIGICDATPRFAVDAIAHLLEARIETAMMPEAQVQTLLDRHFSGETKAARKQEDSREIAVADDGSIVVADDGPIIRLAHGIIRHGIEQRASDIHLEPFRNRLRVRYRVDGVLRDAGSPPQRLQAAITSRLKLMAGVSIAEKRLPQDGRISFSQGNAHYDLRVACCPGAHGESVVMRVLAKERARVDLSELGLAADDQSTLERLIAQRDGMILVTGPTGSGKTTTLYACLHRLNRADRKLISVEDPVEYQLTGINQVSVQAETGVTFVSALRAMLRQSPNVVMIGEIRDRETAEITLNASLTGHLVFSTLHTNDAVSAVTRLADLGIKPFLIATALRAVIAQRMVRRICPECRRAHNANGVEKGVFAGAGIALSEMRLAVGEGCAACEGTGYRGQMGVFEILVPSEEFRRLVHQQATLAELRACAKAGGLRTMREDGLRKASGGLTTLAEVLSITSED